MSIQTDLTRIKSAKAAIKAAIEGKGVTVPDATLLDGMAALIDSIEAGGGGGATEPYIEETYDSNGDLVSAILHGYTNIRNRLFYGCSKLALTSLPSGITTIGNYAFTNCSNLALTSLPSGVTTIGSQAFYRCSNLVSITFEGKPTSVGSNSFSGCPKLTTINVPWAEGEVANAPWGATNATINYNYTGG